MTYIFVPDEEDVIIGYYNIGVGRIDQIEHIGNSIRYIPMGGTANINYLAVNKEFQHTILIPNTKIYFGDYILHDCEKRIISIRENIGIQFISLCSTKEGYHMYHDRNSYDNFEDDMSNFVIDSDKSSIKLYKYIEDIIE